MASERLSADLLPALRLAASHCDAGRLEEAERVARDLLEAAPESPEPWHLLGVIAQRLGSEPMALGLFEEAVRLDSSRPEFLNSLGITLRNLGRLEDAERNFRQASVLRSGYADAHNNLGNVLRELGQPEKAERSLRKALALKHGYAEAHGNLGIVLRELGRLEEAEHCLQRAIALDAGYAEAHNDLGATRFGLGRLEEAERSYRQALELDPKLSVAQGNLVFLLNYVAERSPQEIYHEHRAYARGFKQTADPRPLRNVRNPERRLRVGYVSGDLRQHPVAHFIEPVLARHERGAFEVFCYHNAPRSDAVTARLKSHAAHWRDVFASNDDALVDRIREDAIDILVDLSGHTLRHRLRAFARKPAPVQVTWLGYLNTTGLEEIDYRITDRHASPEGLLEAYHSEKLVRLPDSQWCYQPPADCPEPAPPPSARAGYVTFAAFANPAKIGPRVMELWGRLLERVSGARLLVVTNGLASIPAQYLERFARHGVPKARLQLLGSQPLPDYLALHQSADVVLDTFPYTGGTTTCHALWMGVPVVSLVGDTAPSRGGASLLNAVGLGELVAQTPDQYLEIAAALAGDPGRLAALRAGLRERLRASPLMDAERFTRNLEAAYRTMWRCWCAQQSERTLLGRLRARLRRIF